MLSNYYLYKQKMDWMLFYFNGSLFFSIGQCIVLEYLISSVEVFFHYSFLISKVTILHYYPTVYIQSNCLFFAIS